MLKWIVSTSVANILAFTVTAAPPATQPAVDIVVQPFASLGNDHSPDWIAPAVQKNLIADLSTAKFAATEATAGKIEAQFIITGNYQTIDGQYRFTGQIINAKLGVAVGGLTETGSLRDLFAIEDSLSHQAIKQLRAIQNPPPIATPQQPVVNAAPPPPVSYAKSYEGSALQAYLNANITPSNEYNAQQQQAEWRSRYRNDYGYGYSGWCGYAGGFYGNSFHYPIFFGSTTDQYRFHNEYRYHY